MRLFLKACCCLLVLSGMALAQTDRGTITGTVSDPTGAMIGNAVVVAKNSQTGDEHQVATTTTGNYTIAQLPAGTYDVSVTASGFKKYVRIGIIVSVAQTVRVDASLEVGQISEMVTVNAEAPLLKTESGELSHNINYDRVDQLPLATLSGSGFGLGNIRNPLSAVALLPGSSFSTDSLLRINGLPSSTASIRIEGQDATNGMWREVTQVNQAGMDAIQEVAIQTSNFAAEYGQAGGGYINYTMKSGTNVLHGSAYDYNNNEAYNAGIPNTNDGTGAHVKNRLRRNDYGFTLGGPIDIPHVFNGRDKAFFFFSFEQFREAQGIANGIDTVPTDAYRAGDFSKAIFPVPLPPDSAGHSYLAYTVMNPATTQVVNGHQVRTPFMGCNGNQPGVICTTDPTSPSYAKLDPTAMAIQKLIPEPNMPGLINNYAVPSYSNFRHTTIPEFKIDVAVSSKMKMSGYFSETKTFAPNNNGLPQSLFPVAPTDTQSYTSRYNIDYTIKPTMLFHFGMGLMLTDNPTQPPSFDPASIGWAPNEQFAASYFPQLGGLYNYFTGGLSCGFFCSPGVGLGPFQLRDIKPTSNASVTWVKGNHTIKYGAEVLLEGFPQQSGYRANGIYAFSNIETSNPWENGQQTFGFNTGFPYASFLLGLSDSLQDTVYSDTRLGNHSYGLFVQDTWKVTHRLTLDYGLRYDYQTLLREQYGRMQNANFTEPNPVVGGLPGNMDYEATCHCSFAHNYPYAFGPRLGVAWQISTNTVLRAGSGISYGTSSNNAFLSYSVPDFTTVPTNGYGLPATILSQGNPYAPGNVFGNAPLVWPDFAPHFPIETAPGVIPPGAPFISIDRNAGRPPRILQWSLGLQHQFARNLVVEASYVGNRGVWWTAPVLAAQNYNALTPQGLMGSQGLQYGNTTGINVGNPADLALLSDQINNPAVIARFPKLANPSNVYPGFPATEPLNQALRPHPQWLGIPPFLGPPLGDTWYDSLQVKVTKRYSHGLDVQAAFTWQKELTNGVNSDTSYFTPGTLVVNDVFDRASQKQISALSIPEMLVLSFNYQTPRLAANAAAFRFLSVVMRDWTFSGVLRYQSGALISAATSTNNFLSQLARGPSNNPALWGGGVTTDNRVPGQPLLLVDPNCHCFDPTQQLVLNPKAWADPGSGKFGTSAGYYNDYRWQRQPSESLSLGRLFPLNKENRATLLVRMELFNVFNRMRLSAPTVGAITTATAYNNPGGALSAGYGFVNTFNGIGAQPRTGQIVARVNF